MSPCDSEREMPEAGTGFLLDRESNDWAQSLEFRDFEPKAGLDPCTGVGRGPGPSQNMPVTL